MQNQTNDSLQINELVTPRELQKMVPAIFPSPGSLDWELRTNRAEYISGGAMMEIGGRLLLHPKRFCDISMRIGAARLAKRLERKEAQSTQNA